MSLPEILPPDGTPAFLLAGSGINPRPVFADVPMGTGHTRRRRVSTIAPRVVPVAWFLTASQMAAVDAWHEGTLLVGVRRFAARLKNQGSGFLWWDAQWLGMYTADPVPMGHPDAQLVDGLGARIAWRVTGRLLLTGEGSATPPVSTGMQLEVGMALTGSASLTVGTSLGLEVGVALQQPVALSLEVRMALLSGYGAPGRVTTTGARRVTSSGAVRVISI